MKALRKNFPYMKGELSRVKPGTMVHLVFNDRFVAGAFHSIDEECVTLSYGNNAVYKTFQLSEIRSFCLI